MSQLPILAYPVRHLTDARYFAAWNVDWIGYELDLQLPDYASPQEISAMREWVEGPSTAIHCGRHQYNEIPSFIQLIGADGILLDWPEDEQWPILPEDVKLFIHFAEKPRKSLNEIVFPVPYNRLQLVLAADEHDLSYWVDDIKAFLQQGTSLFINPSQDVGSLREKIEAYPGLGLWLRGGEEEKTGFKSFDELDEILEKMEDLLW